MPLTLNKVCKKTFKRTALILLLLCGMQLSVAVHAQNSGGDPGSGIEDGSTRIPVKVAVRFDTSPNQSDGGHNTSYTGPTIWGHVTSYDLKLLDNKGNFYGLGDVSEQFLNSKDAIYTWCAGAPNNPSTWHNGQDFVAGKFTDTNGVTEGSQDTGAGTFWYSFDQVWHSTNSSAGSVTLNTHHVQHVQAHATRTAN